MAKPEYFVFNDENVKNSYGFYINTLGIRMDRFNDNPVMLNNHINSNENVIGNWSEALKENGLLKLKPHFDEETSLGKDVAGKVDRGYLKGCSMGIIPNWDSVERVGDRLVMMECELAEGSIIPVPSNKGAIAIYSVDGELMKEEDVKSLCLSVTDKLNEIPENLNTKLDMKKIILSVATLMALGFKDQPIDGHDTVDVEAKVLGLSNQVQTLTTENESLKLSAKAAKEAQELATKSRIETKVDLAISKGQIKADQKEEMTNLGITSEKALDTVLGSIPEKKNFSAGVITPSGTGAVEVNSMEEFQKLSFDAQLAFKTDSPEEYKKIVG
ncbi:HK97 family phage prohead protease [Flavobacterium geliluteum]|uniref:HK97 family phage prohead protease n=1 Tax=Flavobacterium geliluteum TaxID=2816120 RepID=A0A941AYN7_9FLAO|nr:HK97 family phage prohead protease [Flavobacterium geliluteum]MBP4139631.1 HK97 family phage prohead protease [Flavobacterium geliluteum]